LYPTSDSSRTGAQEATAIPRVLVVGAGALGCAAARTLARDCAAGRSAERSVAVTLVDDDRVELSNLQRQVLYTEDDIGSLKVEAAASRLARDYGANVEAIALRFDRETGPALLANCDLVLDATDDPATKFLIGRLAVAARTPFVYGGVARTGGQWMLVVPGESACLECVFPAVGTSEGAVESAAGCSALGILAPVAGMIGAMQALTALTFFQRREHAIAGRLHVYELTGARSRHIDFAADANCFCNAADRRRKPRRIVETNFDRRLAS
jgi:molybdopterin/thiamine biosynthesis adenylyltransferase